MSENARVRAKREAENRKRRTAGLPEYTADTFRDTFPDLVQAAMDISSSSSYGSDGGGCSSSDSGGYSGGSDGGSCGGGGGD